MSLVHSDDYRPRKDTAPRKTQEEYESSQLLQESFLEETVIRLAAQAITTNPASGTYNTTVTEEITATLLILKATVTTAGVLHFDISINGVALGRFSMSSVTTGNNECYHVLVPLPNIKLKVGDNIKVVTSAIAATGDLSFRILGFV